MSDEEGPSQVQPCDVPEGGGSQSAEEIKYSLVTFLREVAARVLKKVPVKYSLVTFLREVAARVMKKAPVKYSLVTFLREVAARVLKKSSTAL